MDTNAPKPKKTSQQLLNPLPGFVEDSITHELVLSATFVGTFNGMGVIVDDLHAIENLYNNGFFGKGSLSRSIPDVMLNENNPIIMKERQYNNTQGLMNDMNLYNKNINLEKCIILPDSDDEDIETDIDVLKLTFSDLSSLLKETESHKEIFLLMLEEAFFLTYAIGCLKIKDESGQILNFEEIWNLFKNVQADFIPKYIVYHYFRCKNWVVKSGLKYGSEFLLYKDGPTFYHASYAVKIQVYINNGEEIYGKQLTRNQMNALTRLLNSSGKEVLLAQVFYPNDFDMKINNLYKVKINEVQLKTLFLKDIMMQ